MVCTNLSSRFTSRMHDHRIAPEAGRSTVAATLTDVARRAGVSIATASRAFGEPDRLAADHARAGARRPRRTSGYATSQSATADPHVRRRRPRRREPRLRDAAQGDPGPGLAWSPPHRAVRRRRGPASRARADRAGPQARRDAAVLAAPARRRGARARRRHPVRRGQPPDRRRALRADGHRERTRPGHRAPRRPGSHAHRLRRGTPRTPGRTSAVPTRSPRRASDTASGSPASATTPRRSRAAAPPRPRPPRAAPRPSIAYNDLVALGLEAGTARARQALPRRHQHRRHRRHRPRAVPSPRRSPPCGCRSSAAAHSRSTCCCRP